MTIDERLAAAEQEIAALRTVVESQQTLIQGMVESQVNLTKTMLDLNQQMVTLKRVVNDARSRLMRADGRAILRGAT